MSKLKAKRLELELNNKDLLLQVCGINDNNLKFIEARLKVQLIAKGNNISILGTSPDTDIAYNAIVSIYELAQTGLNIEESNIKAALQIERSSLKNKQEQKNDSTGNVIDDISSNYTAKNASLVITPLSKIAPRTQMQKDYVTTLRNNTLSFGVGPAGTGKTYLATAVAVEKLMKKQVSKIILTRPVVEAGESLGFLPGTLEEKIDPYLRPFFDAINEMLGAERVQKLMEQSVIEIAPLAYMRGRTLKNSFIILDEAQNTTTMQMKMFLTRLGENSQMVITGDLSQTDLPSRVKSGLKDAVSKLSNIDDISIITFKAKDILRHDLVSKIVKAYEENTDEE